MSAGSAHGIATQTRAVQIAIAGNPNSGKTTVFNALTGLRHRVANYPGVTVEKREGTLTGTDRVILDLPGTYSLSARSPDEEIARDVLLGRIQGVPRPDVILLVIDASNLERNLYLASQVLEFGTPVIVACNMMDVAEARDMIVDTDALSRELGVPVIPTSARSGRGLDQIRTALRGEFAVNQARRAWELHPEIEAGARRIAGVIESARVIPQHAVQAGSLLWIADYLSDDAASVASAKRFLKKLPPQSAAELEAVAERVGRQCEDAAEIIIESRYAWVARLAAAVTRPVRESAARRPPISPTDRLDAILTHRVYGFLIFAVVMLLLFLSIFSWAEPLMALIEAGQAHAAQLVQATVPEGPIQSLLVDGVIAGVGSVVVFFPQICILFLFLSIMEDSGYTARAAFLMDKLMHRAGLHGRSFIPLLSSYACAIPGIMATRTIENPRDRLTTILIAPLMSCSARLPVYLIVIAAVFGNRLWLKTGVMFGLYILGTATALLMAVIFKKTILKGPPPAFIMELPPYHLPQPGAVLRTMWDRSRLFLTGAGTTIVAACIVIWALSYFPRAEGLSESAQAELATIDPADPAARAHFLEGEQLRQSFLGRMGHAIEPLIQPLGYDWRLGVGILSSFLAREVFVGTMAITFSLGDADSASESLRDRMASATWPDGRPVLTPRVGVSLMVFYVLACQCVSTLAVVRRETGTWRWPAFMFAYMTALAYGGALLVNQAGAALGWA